MFKKYASRKSEERSIFESQKAFWEPYYQGLEAMLERELEHMAAEIDAAEKEVEEI